MDEWWSNGPGERVLGDSGSNGWEQGGRGSVPPTTGGGTTEAGPEDPNPPPGPPPGPPGPPPQPGPGDPFRCASARASSISLAYWAGVENSSVGQVLLGNDFSAMSNLAFGPNRGGAGVDVALSNPTSRNVVSFAARMALLVPVTPERLRLAQNGAGNYYVQKVTGGALGKTGVGAMLRGLGALYTVPKAAYDGGTYLGSLITCFAR